MLDPDALALKRARSPSPDAPEENRQIVLATKKVPKPNRVIRRQAKGRALPALPAPPSLELQVSSAKPCMISSSSGADDEAAAAPQLGEDGLVLVPVRVSGCWPAGTSVKKGKLGRASGPKRVEERRQEQEGRGKKGRSVSTGYLRKPGETVQAGGSCTGGTLGGDLEPVKEGEGEGVLGGEAGGGSATNCRRERSRSPPCRTRCVLTRGSSSTGSDGGEAARTTLQHGDFVLKIQKAVQVEGGAAIGALEEGGGGLETPGDPSL